jgi:hypothetical protein
VLDGKTGKLLASFQSGAGTDAAGWDAKNGLAFISNGEATSRLFRRNRPIAWLNLIGRLSPCSRQFTQFTKH